MNDEQERHEQLMYRLDQIEKHILRLDGRATETAKKVAAFERGIKQILPPLVIWLVGGGVFYLAQEWGGNALVYVIAGSLVIGTIAFLILRALWRKLRMWVRVEFAEIGAFYFKVGDRVSVFRSEPGFGRAGRMGTVVPDEWEPDEWDPKVVRVKWDDEHYPSEESYRDAEIYNLDNLDKTERRHRRRALWRKLLG
jgi:hypothetical protein